MTRQIFDVLVLGVDDFSELLTVHNLLVNVHLDFVVEIVEFLYVSADDLGDRRAPDWKILWLVQFRLEAN